MIVSADALGDALILRTDLCIVGAGPAGISLALQLAESGADILVLESGGRRPDAESQELCAGEVAEPATHPPANMFRRRGLGGSSSVWGGRCVPLDPIDFASRPWLDTPSGWPISYDILVPYWRAAHRRAQLGSYDYAAATAVPGGMRPMFPAFQPGAVSTGSIERFSPPTDFGKTYEGALRRHRRVRVVLHATCTCIVLHPGLRRVSHLSVARRCGAAMQVYARRFVLAAGGLETPRLLLASRAQMPGGIGNAHGLVGRYYMCHLAGLFGRFVPSRGAVPFHGYERTPDGIYCRRRLSIAPWAQQTYATSNCTARLHHPPIWDAAHRSGALSAVQLFRFLLPAEYGGQQNATALLPHVRNVVCDPIGSARFASLYLRRRVLAVRKLPSVAVKPRSGTYTLEIHAEQLPNAESRVSLAHNCDRFGMPQLRIDWRYLPQDARGIGVATGLIAASLAAGGHGILACEPDVDAFIRREGAYGGHHLGTARMSASPCTGVVDSDCRVHGTENLYIVGGAVFPLSGQANPTLTILALALRLADHLQSVLARPASPSPHAPAHGEISA
jgi:choline dehydrogenase-like flavoprotein